MSKYYTVVRKNNMSLAMEYDLNHKTISKLRNYKFYNKNEILVEINKINKLLKKEFLKIGTSHVQKNKLIKNP